jgi:hypothetical protein
MKKTYKNPTLTVVNTQPAQFIAVSTLGTTSLRSGNLGRESRFSEYDDEEE